MAHAILTDLTRCIGCKACAYACKEINELPKEEMGELNATTWTMVEQRAGLNIRRQCMHCLDPTCASVCPVAALQKLPEGPAARPDGAVLSRRRYRGGRHRPPAGRRRLAGCSRRIPADRPLTDIRRRPTFQTRYSTDPITPRR